MILPVFSCRGRQSRVAPCTGGTTPAPMAPAAFQWRERLGQLIDAMDRSVEEIGSGGHQLSRNPRMSSGRSGPQQRHGHSESCASRRSKLDHRRDVPQVARQRRSAHVATGTRRNIPGECERGWRAGGVMGTYFTSQKSLLSLRKSDSTTPQKLPRADAVTSAVQLQARETWRSDVPSPCLDGSVTRGGSWSIPAVHPCSLRGGGCGVDPFGEEEAVGSSQDQAPQ